MDTENSSDKKNTFLSIRRYIGDIAISRIVFFMPLFFFLLLGLYLIDGFLFKNAHTTLFSNLSPRDSQLVIRELNRLNVDFELRNSGRVISVSPPESVYPLRIELASKGIPNRARVGVDPFDYSDVSVSSFVERIRHAHTLQGELEKTINSIEGINSTRVHISNAKENESPSASVVVELDRVNSLDGNYLGVAQINGIVNLVSASVDGLDSKNVSLISSKGVRLNTSSFGNLFIGNKNKLYFQKNLEKIYIDRIKSILEPIYGKNNIVAQVSAEVDYVEKNFDKNEAELLVGSSPIVLNRLSVAVLLDSSALDEKSSEDSDSLLKPRFSDLAKVKKLVMATVGYDFNRGDVITVEDVSFKSSEEVSGAVGFNYWRLLELIVPIIIIYILATLVLKPFLAFLSTLFENINRFSKRTPSTESSFLKDQSAGKIRSTDSFLNNFQNQYSVDIREGDSVGGQILQQDKSEVAAQLLRGWLQDS